MSMHNRLIVRSLFALVLIASGFGSGMHSAESCCGNEAGTQPLTPSDDQAVVPVEERLKIPPQWPATVNRVSPSVAVPPSAAPAVPDESATDDAIVGFRRFPERLAPTGPTDQAENRALMKALKAYPAETDPTALAPIKEFLATHPGSVWRVALLANMGLVYRRHGYFSRALASWGETWEAGRGVADGPAKQLVDLAVAELTQLNAWVGRQGEMDRLMGEVGGREMAGIANEKMTASRYGRELMREEPESSFKCGPFALQRILSHFNGGPIAHPAIDEFRTTPQGTSLLEVRDLAARVGMPMQVIKGGVSAELPLPAVMHWKLNHYSALLRIEGERALVQDSTMDAFEGRERWISLAALNEEASGYFLIRAGKVPSTHAVVEDDEAGLYFGRGQPGNGHHPQATTCWDGQCGGDQKDCGMPGYSFMAMSLSVRVMDKPLFYTSPRNGEIGFNLVYNEREATQPALFTYANLGPRWSLNWIDYIVDDPANSNASQTLSRGTGGGGGFSYKMTNGVSAAEKYTGDVLQKVNATSYEMKHPDGSRSVYGQVDGTVYPRRLFLTQVIDPSGNTITINYQAVAAGLRLTSVVDSLGQASTFAYTHSDPLKITRITDPFGRFTDIVYNATGRLVSITDAVGMSSSFAYESGDAIASLTTPYGTTRFRRETTNYRYRWVEATDPNGDTERLMSTHFGPHIDHAGHVPATEAEDLPIQLYCGGPGFCYRSLNYYSSYYWDKKAHKASPGNFNDAVQYKWTMHEGGISHTAPWGRVLAAMRPAREEYVFFQYPGQTDCLSEYGVTIGKPRLVARLMDDGTTQRTRYTYLPNGQVTSVKDPLGRITEYTYHANNMDLLEVRQRVDATTTQLLASATYNAAHQPLTMTDAAGKSTTITYNGFGQVETVTNAKNELTRLIYDANGYLTTIRDPLLGDRGVEYDGYARPRKVTDVDGHFTVTDYDGLNRPLRVTYPDNTFEQILYNRLDAEWLRDRQGRWTHQFHDSLGRLVATRDPLGRMSSIDWCSCGKPSSLTDALGRKTSWTLDMQGRVTGKTYADNRSVTMTYQPKSGRLATVTDALGQVTTYSYFLDNQVQSVTYGSAARPTPGISFTYDAIFGRMATMVDGTGTTTYAYHPITAGPAFTTGAGRLASIDGPLANDTVSFGYDELGRVLNRSLGLGATAGSYTQGVTYDALGRVSAQANELGNFGYTYVGKTGRLDTVTLPGGMTTTLGYHPMTQDFRLAGITHKRSGGAVISSHAYTYSPAGAITSWAMQTDVDGSSTFQFTNDDTDQLVSAVRTGTIPTGAPAVSSFRYDAAGNRLTTQLDKVVQTHSYNNLNQLTGTTAGGLLRVEGHLDELATVTVNNVNAKVTADKKYVAEVPVTTGSNTITVRATDANNNVAQKQWLVTGITGTAASPTYDFNGNTTNDGTRGYEWDAKDRVKAIVQGALRSEFTYDGLGRRVRIVEKNGATVTSDKRFVWVGAEIVQEREASTNAVTKRFNGHGVLGANGVLVYLRDHLGSVREAMDTTGSVRARYDYEVYGKRRKVRGDLIADVGFTGHYQHETSGLVMAWLRLYNPEIGAWINRDPLDSLNEYHYSSNSPVNKLDLLGGPDEWHHMLPRQFAPFWQALGIDFNASDFGKILDKADHNALHCAGWNEEWDSFTSKPRTKEEVMRKLEDMKKDKRFNAILSKGKNTSMGYKQWRRANWAARLSAIVSSGGSAAKAARALLAILGPAATGLAAIEGCERASDAVDTWIQAAESGSEDAMSDAAQVIGESLAPAGGGLGNGAAFGLTIDALTP